MALQHKAGKQLHKSRVVTESYVIMIV